MTLGQMLELLPQDNGLVYLLEFNDKRIFSTSFSYVDKRQKKSSKEDASYVVFKFENNDDWGCIFDLRNKIEVGPKFNSICFRFGDFDDDDDEYSVVTFIVYTSLEVYV